MTWNNRWLSLFVLSLFVLLFVCSCLLLTNYYRGAAYTGLSEYYEARGDAGSASHLSTLDRESVQRRLTTGVGGSLLLRNRWEQLLLDANELIYPGTSIGEEFLDNRGHFGRVQATGEAELCLESVGLRRAKEQLLQKVRELLQSDLEGSPAALSELLDTDAKSARTVGFSSLTYVFLFRLAIDDLRYLMYCKGDESSTREQWELLARMMDCASRIPKSPGMVMRIGSYSAIVGVLCDHFSERGSASMPFGEFNRVDALTWKSETFERSYNASVDYDLELLTQWIDEGVPVETYPVSRFEKFSRRVPRLSLSRIAELTRYLDFVERDWIELVKNGSYSDFTDERTYVERSSQGWQGSGLTFTPIANRISKIRFSSAIAREWDYKMLIDMLWVGLQIELHRDSFEELPEDLSVFSDGRRGLDLDGFSYRFSETGYTLECLNVAFPAEMPVWEVDF